MLDEVRPALGADAGWIDISIAGLVARLRDLVDVMQDCRLLREAIADGRNPESLRLAFRLDALAVAVPHRDHGLASGPARQRLVLACCVFWIATGWTDGASAAFLPPCQTHFYGLDIRFRHFLP